MAETIYIDSNLDKKEQYQQLFPQISALIRHETDLIANMANVAAALKAVFNWLWVGFYLVKDNELVLGPFQGPVACTRIAFDKGVCGKSWSSKSTLIVPDVNKFPGHISCNARSKSEIVVPGIKNGKVLFVLDIDSEHFDAFDQTDKKELEKIVGLLTPTN